MQTFNPELLPLQCQFKVSNRIYKLTKGDLDIELKMSAIHILYANKAVS